MGDLPESGRLEETPLPRLLLDLQGGLFTGSLQLSRHRVEKEFLFHEGLPVLVESNRESERLGNQLVESEKISRDDHSKLKSYVEKEQCREGKALLALGLMEPKDLFLAIKEQLRASLVDCFGWTGGEFVLDAERKPPDDAQAFRTDLNQILQEGIETHWDTERIMTALGNHMSLFPVRGDRFLRTAPRLRSDDAVQALLERIDGSHTLWRCLQVARTPRAFAALWLLDATGAIEYRESAEDSGNAGEGEVKIEIVRPGEESAAPAEAPAAPTQSERPAEASRDAAAEQLSHAIEEKSRHLADLDYYEILGVDSGVDAAAIKRAYLQAAKTYHPDALARSGLDEGMRRQAGKLFAEMGTAYAVLSNPAKRKDYDSSQGGGSEDAERLATAETLFRKGEVLLRLGNFKGALEFLKPAVGLWPEESEYQSALGWALYKKMPSETEAARESLEQAVQLDPQSATALFRLSVVLRELGEADEAASLLVRAKQIDPNVS